MGTGGTPTIPMYIGQGANGLPEGTPGNKPGIGRGDGVMIAGDVRTLARYYCEQGTAVYYEEYGLLSHTSTVELSDEGDRLDHRPLRRTVCAEQLRVDPARQSAGPHSAAQVSSVIGARRHIPQCQPLSEYFAPRLTISQ